MNNPSVSWQHCCLAAGAPSIHTCLLLQGGWCPGDRHFKRLHILNASSAPTGKSVEAMTRFWLCFCRHVSGVAFLIAIGSSGMYREIRQDHDCIDEVTPHSVSQIVWFWKEFNWSISVRIQSYKPATMDFSSVCRLRICATKLMILLQK